jgi:signal transduction histidine kinase
VADAVLDNGQSYLGEAFVVKDRYLTAYDPIRDGAGRIIGMLYVGMLKEPYGVMGRGIMLRYGLLSLFVLLVALVMAFIHAGRLAQPIHRLVEVSNRMSDGHRPEPVVEDGTCHETDRLIGAFNQMTAALAEREEKLKALNRSYMETLGFVSHELKSPVATIMNYAYLLKEQKLGPLNEKQQKAVRAVDAGSTRLVEMVRHYLNLARIENGELEPVRTAVAVREEILQPLIEVAEAELQAKGMRLTNGVGADIALSADLNMVREVFENLLSNAMKYGRPGGCIEIEAKPDGEHVEFVVRNEGEGVPADRLPELFQKFSRIGNGEARRQKGTGLGLFITRSIVEAHGGQIRAASRAGEWAEFTFTLPRYREQT